MEFITITTGATAISPRSQVDDSVVARISQAIDRDGTGPDDRVKLWLDWSVEIQHGQFDATGSAIFLAFHHDLCMARCAVCWQKRASDQLWEIVSDSAPEHTVLHRPRGVPWLAADITMPAITLGVEPMMQLADLERCIAWTLIERAQQ